MKSLFFSIRNNITSDKKNYYIISLFLIGSIIRFIFLGSIPPGLNCDEALVGYYSYSILNYGIDKDGLHNPVHFMGGENGDGMNALYIYLSMPFIALFGLSTFSVRFLAAIIGCISLFIFYKIVRKVWNKDAALISLFALVINPWHIMISHCPLDTNFFPSVFLIGIYFLVISKEKKWALPVSFLIFGLSLYTYGPSYFFVPVFIGFCIIILFLLKKEKISSLAISSSIFALIATPIFLFILINMFKWPTIENIFFSIPRLKGIPRVNTVSSFFSYDIISQSILNFKEFLKIFLAQNDNCIYNSIPQFGFMYPFSLPFVAAGLYKTVKDRKIIGHFYLIFVSWLILAFALGFLLFPNINRINILFYILVFYIGLGLYELKNNSVIFFRSSIVIYILFFLMFSRYYIIKYPGIEVFPESLGEAISYAQKNTSVNSKIYVTNQIPYVYVLFYTKEDPRAFKNSVVYDKNYACKPTSYGRYVFGIQNTNNFSGETYIFHNSETDYFKSNAFVVKKFKRFSVAIRKHSWTVNTNNP